MSNKNVTWNIDNNTQKIGAPYINPGFFGADIDLVVNMNSQAGGSTGFTFDNFFYATATHRYNPIKTISVSGGEGSDTFTLNHITSSASGTGWKSYLDMKGGNDIVIMKESEHGTDTIYLGAGDDRAEAGWGNDEVHGGTGNDTIKGGAGDDNLSGDDGSDFLYGGDGADLLHGGNGDDMLVAGVGNDIVYGDAGNDQLWATTLTGLMIPDGSHPMLFGGAGSDLFTIAADPFANPLASTAAGAWGSFVADTLDKANGSGIVANVLQAASAAGMAWNPVSATATAFGNDNLSKLGQILGAGDWPINTFQTRPDTFVTVKDFDPRVDTLQLSLYIPTPPDQSMPDPSLTVSANAGVYTMHISDAQDIVRAEVVLDSAFAALFNNDTAAMQNMMNVYQRSGLTISANGVTSNGADITSSLSNYGLSVSGMGGWQSSGKTYVMGAFAGQTIDGGYAASTTVLTGSAGADLVTAQRIDFNHSDPLNAIKSMDQVDTTNPSVLYGAGGSDVLIGGAGNDKLYGGDGVDHLFGLGGNNTLSGGAGDDVFHILSNCLSVPQSGALANSGTEGNDTITDYAVGDRIYIDNPAIRMTDIHFGTDRVNTIISFTDQHNTVTNTLTLQGIALTKWTFITEFEADGHISIIGHRGIDPIFV